MAPREKIDACIPADEHHDHVDLIEQGQEQHGKGQVAQDGVQTDVGETVRLHHDAGVPEQGPHHEMDVAHQRQGGHDEQGDDNPSLEGWTFFHRLVDPVAHHKQRIKGECDGDVVEQQAAQGIE